VSRFQVNPDELVTLGQQLERIGRELKGTGSRLRIGDATAHPRVAQALGHFADQWDYALGKISEHAANVAGNLKGAGEAYARSDQEIAKAAGTSGG
jgi:hypothetical protein